MNRKLSENKRNILIVTPGLQGLGGVANYYKTILPLLERTEFSIDFLEIGSAKRKGKIFYPIFDQFKFSNQIRKKRPILIHINPSLDPKSFIRDGLLVHQARRRNIPVVVFFHGWDRVFAQVIEKYFLKLFNSTYGKASALIVLAREFKEKLLTWKVDSPIYIETTTVNPSIIENFDIEKRVAALRKKRFFRILYLARIEQAKGIFETVNAIKLLCDRGAPVSLSIAGDGPAKQELESYVDSLKLPSHTIRFLGYVRDMKKASAFENHEIYCFPSYYKEGLPVAVLEALAFGMPVITCAVGGLVDIFRDEEMGALVPMRDAEAVANKIERLISDRESMSRISRNNHAYAKKNFLAPKVAMRMLDIYRGTIV